MILIATALTLLSPAHAQDCGVISYTESDSADWDEDTEMLDVDEVGSVVQLESGCEGECVWKLYDFDANDGQPVGKLVDIDDEQGNQGQEIQAHRVWYQTPDDLKGCIDVESAVILDCSRLTNEDPTDGDTLYVLTESPFEDRCSVTGGGCIAPQATGIQEAGGWLLLPLLGLMIRRRTV